MREFAQGPHDAGNALHPLLHLAHGGGQFGKHEIHVVLLAQAGRLVQQYPACGAFRAGRGPAQQCVIPGDGRVQRRGGRVQKTRIVAHELDGGVDLVCDARGQLPDGLQLLGLQQLGLQ